MTAKKQGFTLIELLIVLAIIAVLVGIAFPVIVSARANARRTASISNLRQCGLALRMYCDDYGGSEAMPSGEVAAKILEHAPTCDPGDTWRKNCAENFGSPLIGSYAYVRNAALITSREEWLSFLHNKRNPTLLASVYYADPVPTPFHGEKRSDSANCITVEHCDMPDRVLRLRLDGSAGMTRQQVAIGSARLRLTWNALFWDDNPESKWIPK